MRKIIFLIALVPLLYGCVCIFVPKELVYKLPEELYAGKVYYLKLGFKNDLGFLMPNLTVKVDGVDYRTDDYGYATIQLYYEQIGIKELKIECGSISRTLKIKVVKPSWLVFVWVSSDNNLDKYVTDDLQEMTKAAEDVSVIVLWDSSDLSKDGIYILTIDSTLVKTEETGEINSGDGNLLRKYTEKFSEIDSDYKALIIWNHGSAWCDVVPENYKTKGIAYDDQSKDFLTISEIANNVIGSWDVLGMDACLMGSIEVIYALREITNYIVASAHNIQGTGWDYKFLSSVNQKGPSEFCTELVNYYKEYYRNYPNISLAVYKTDVVNDAVNLFNDFLSTCSMKLQPNWTNYSQSYCLYDLGEVLESLRATETLEKFNEVVVYKYLSNAKSKSLATSIFFSKDVSKIHDLGYTLTEFAQNTGWDEFLLNQ